MLSPRMRISEAPFGSGRLCIGVLSETPNGSGRPAFPQYMRTSTQHHMVLEEAEQQTCTREQMQTNMHAHVHIPACIYRLTSMYAWLYMCVGSCLYMSAYVHMYFYRLYMSAYVHVYPSPRARKRRKCTWHSKTTPIDPHPRGPAWHTANWLALHARLTWMIAGTQYTTIEAPSSRTSREGRKRA